jgi:large subunit ribosomal protein L5
MADKKTTEQPAKAAAKPAKKATVVTTARLRHQYASTIAAELQKELGLANAHQVPKLQKITINVGLGKAKDDKKMFEAATNTLTKITGQKPQETVAKQSIASFKLREGNKIGLKVTLRGDKMYEFLDRFITIVLPRLRDFHGVNPKAFDRQGNFAIGLTDQSVFPELSFEETTTAHGLQAVLTISGGSPAYSRALLEKFGMPFEKETK